MKTGLLIAAVLACGALLATTAAEAKRLGASRSVGTQRSIATPPASAPSRATQPAPAGQQAAPVQPAPASPASRWLPLLGGLAIGGMLGALFGGSGLGGLVLIALLAFAAVAAVRFFAARASTPAPGMARLAGAPGGAAAAAPAEAAAGGPRMATSQPGIPADFDTAGFLRSAKLNFVRLQIANDGGRLDEIREFTTQEMYEALRRDVAERSGSQQQTDVVSLDADLLELATEQGRHWASVRFSGTVRETPDTAPEGFEEVWNLVKPADGSSGWLLAGIQQMH
jgi:predicted lipid-binding transport protein (Tim44 family)